jgi:hypothetical protein
MKDLTGMVFGEMVVLGFAGYNTPKSGKRRPQWLIRCSCGVEKTMLGTTLRNTNAKSCGHLHGVKSIPAGGAAVNLRLNQYKSSAAKYGREFSLSRDEFAALLLGDCTYCGISPSSVVRARGKFQKDFYYNGIDRVDNSLGYTVDNCVSCCGICNLMKRTMSVDDFIKHIHKVAEFNNPLPNREEIG